MRVARKGYPFQYGTFDTKSRCELWAREVEAEIDRGAFVSRTEAEQTTLGDALERYLVEVSAQKRGAKSERSVAAVWRETVFVRRSLASLLSVDFARQRDAWVRGGVSPATLRNRFALLSHLFTVARQDWGMASLGNPVRDVRLPSPDPGRNRRLRPKEEARLLEAADAYGGELGAMIRFAIETAMRRSEITAMRWEHVDTTNHTLLVPDTKNGSPRQVPLSRAARALLADRPPHDGTGRIWSLQPDSLTQGFARVCHKAGIADLTFHDLRHEATSRLFEKGLNPMQGAAITGHKTLQMLQRYTHLKAKDLVALLR